MAGTRFMVKTYGDTIVSRKLLRMAEVAGDMRPAWPAVLPVVTAAINNSFDKQGPGWPPLSASTVRSRIKEGYPPGPMMKRTKQLWRSVVIEPQVRYYASTLTIVSTVSYGQYAFSTRPIHISTYYKKRIADALSQALVMAYEHG